MPSKVRGTESHIRSPHHRQGIITPERVQSVVSYVGGLAADHLPEGSYRITFDKKSVALVHDQSGKRSPWLPKSYRGVPIIKKLKGQHQRSK
jgi:hypothetical protein